MGEEKKYSLRKKLYALLLAASLAALAGEAALRLFAPFPDYSAMTVHSFPDGYHPLLGFAGVPRLDTLFILPDFRNRIVNNSRGFRDREREYGKAAKKRIVVLGDSTAWGWGVEAEERFSDVMEKILRGWEVINLSQAGYSTDQELLVLETEGLKYTPDIVLLLFDRNDVAEGNNARVIDGIQPKPYYAEEGGTLVLRNVPVPYDREYWLRKAALARVYGGAGMQMSWRSWDWWRWKVFARSHLFNWIAFRIAHPAWKSPEERKESEEMLAEKMGLTIKILQRMNKVSGENGARLIIADVPSEYSPLLSRFCREQNIPYVDLAPTLNGRIRPVSHRRVGHWNSYGHRLVAEALSGYLRKNGFLEPKK